MTLMLLPIGGVVIELALLYVGYLWRWRVALIVLVSALLGWQASALFVQQDNGLAALLAVVAAFRLFNLLRIIKEQMHTKYLKRVTRRSSLIFVSLYLSGSLLVATGFDPSWSHLVLPLAVVQLTVASLIAGITVRNMMRSKHRPSDQHYTSEQLPTVTVAVPARNETADLASCLESIVGSDYPKLEVLVLDDCSQDRTPDIIKDFAHEGIRFIQGEAPSDTWLAKNSAYQRLYEEASGKFILFCGVDVRFSRSSIQSLVTAAMQKDKSMLSVMPFRVGGGVRTAFVQPMRYWWELALPRRLFKRPPVLSTCWMIKREEMKSLGGFKAVSRSILPEGFFARELNKKAKYMFIRAGEHLDIRTIKGVEEQIRTAVRTSYPQLRKRPENVLALSLFETALLLMPFVLAASGFWVGFDTSQWLAIATSVILIAVHYAILAISNPANSVIALLNLPLVIMTELTMLYVSMLNYELSTVNWKGRNICIPMMHAVPKQPSTD